jgi:hypothetical protein
MKLFPQDPQSGGGSDQVDLLDFFLSRKVIEEALSIKGSARSGDADTDFQR